MCSISLWTFVVALLRHSLQLNHVTVKLVKVVKKKPVRNLQMNKKEKCGIICALALGYVTSGFAITRLGLLSTQEGVDWTHFPLKESIATESVSPYISNDQTPLLTSLLNRLEGAIAIIAGSVPMLKPLVSKRRASGQSYELREQLYS